MHEELLNELELCAERRDFFRFGLLEDELLFEYGKGIPCSAMTHSKFVACLPEEIRERFANAKKKLLPNYKVDMPGDGGKGTEGDFGRAR